MVVYWFDSVKQKHAVPCTKTLSIDVFLCLWAFQPSPCVANCWGGRVNPKLLNFKLQKRLRTSNKLNLLNLQQLTKLGERIAKKSTLLPKRSKSCHEDIFFRYLFEHNSINRTMYLSCCRLYFNSQRFQVYANQFIDYEFSLPRYFWVE